MSAYAFTILRNAMPLAGFSLKSNLTPDRYLNISTTTSSLTRLALLPFWRTMLVALSALTRARCVFPTGTTIRFSLMFAILRFNDSRIFSIETVDSRPIILPIKFATTDLFSSTSESPTNSHPTSSPHLFRPLRIPLRDLSTCLKSERQGHRTEERVPSQDGDAADSVSGSPSL